MPARDDAGSNYGRPGGSQNSGVNNGGVAGGMGGGFGGGGAGRMGGIGSRTGLTTGNTMFGGMAFGRPGGFAMNSSAFGVRPQAGIAQGPLSGARPRPAAVAGVNPLPENVPPQLSDGYPQMISPNLGPFNPPNYTPPSMPIQGPGAVGPTGYFMKNPTGYPQWAGGWKNQTDNYSLGNTYPGGLNYTRQIGRDNTWSNDDNRFGIDKLARERGY
jgi:hypothetical protein